MENKKNKHKFLNLSHPINTRKKTVGQRAADLISKWAGSWAFIVSFILFLILWIALNTSYLLNHSSWDPYPFILLNLALSCLAAFQAPVILMSQNQENQRDRVRAEYDYAVNRKAEREIEELQEQVKEIKKLLLKYMKGQS